MKEASLILILLFTIISMPSVAGSDNKLDNIFTMVLASAEKFWEASVEKEEMESFPKLAATYIRVGSRFSHIATQMLRSIPESQRVSLCQSVNMQELKCLEFIKKPGSKFDTHFQKYLLRGEFKGLRHLYSYLREQFEDLSHQLVMKDIELFSEMTENVLNRGVAIKDGEALLFNGTLKNNPLRVLEVAGNFEVLGKRAKTLGIKFTNSFTAKTN